jgi:membrane-associated phospholipid phosphatase
MITVNRSICFGALACLVAGILTGGTATMLRSIVGRTRPGAEVVQGWYGPWTDGHWLVGVSAFNAFPSGHTATLAGIAVFAFRRRWPHGWMLASLTGAVGAARIVLAAHRLSDVVASILLALGLARVVDHCVDSMLEEAAAFWRPTAGNGPSSVVAAKETPVMGG